MIDTTRTPQIASIPQRLRMRNSFTSYGIAAGAQSDVDRATTTEQSSVSNLQGNGSSLFRLGILGALRTLLGEIQEGDVKREKSRQQAQLDTHKLALRA